MALHQMWAKKRPLLVRAVVISNAGRDEQRQDKK